MLILRSNFNSSVSAVNGTGQIRLFVGVSVRLSVLLRCKVYLCDTLTALCLCLAAERKKS